MKKNILLAVASFIVTFAFLFQVANAQDADFGARSSSNPPATGDDPNEAIKVTGKDTESNAKVPGIKCTDCEAHATDVALNKKTNPGSNGKAGTGSDTGSSRQGGTK